MSESVGDNISEALGDFVGISNFRRKVVLVVLNHHILRKNWRPDPGRWRKLKPDKSNDPLTMARGVYIGIGGPVENSAK
jgi:hypothetical protein